MWYAAAEKTRDIAESNDKRVHSATNNAGDRIRHNVATLFDCCLQRILQVVMSIITCCYSFVSIFYFLGSNSKI